MTDDALTAAMAEAMWERFGKHPTGPLAAWLTEQDCRRLADTALDALGVTTRTEYGLRGHDGTEYDGADEGRRWTRDQAVYAADQDPGDDTTPDVLLARTVTEWPAPIVGAWQEARP